MSLLHRQVKFNRKSANKAAFKFISGRAKVKAVGWVHTIKTAVVVFFSVLACYTTILYMLPFASPKQILGITQQNYAAASMEDTRVAWLKNTFLKPFELRRTFLGTHQGIRAHYVIPEGKVVALKLEHCMRALIVEAYFCKVVGSSTAEIQAGQGSRHFKFNRVGFYQFKEELRYSGSGKIVPESDQDGYRIIWVRD